MTVGFSRRLCLEPHKTEYHEGVVRGIATPFSVAYCCAATLMRILCRVFWVLIADSLIKSPILPFSVIPAKAGIRQFQILLDAGSSPA